MKNEKVKEEDSSKPLFSNNLLGAVLKSCPFCGRENPSTYLREDGYYTIQCLKCGVMVCDYYYLPVDRWNARK